MSLYSEAFIAQMRHDRQQFASSELVAMLTTDHHRARGSVHQIETLFAMLPQSNKVKFEKRLCDTENTKFIPALNELLFYGYLKGNNLRPEYEPESNGSTPDFVICHDSHCIALELMCDMETPERNKSSLIEARITNRLQEQFPERSFAIHLDCPLNDDVDLTKLLNTVVTRLNCSSLQPVPITSRNGKQLGRIEVCTDHDTESYVAIFEPTPISEKYRKKLVNAIHKKVTKASQFAGDYASFVIVVCQENVMSSEISFLELLYGRTQATFPVPPSPTRSVVWGRDWGGFFTQNPGDEYMPYNTRVSAILRLKRILTPSGEWQLEMQVFHNPFAQRPLSRSVFAGIPQLVADDHTLSTGNMQWLDRVSDSAD